MPEASRKVKGTLHWVSAPYAVKSEVRLYEHLFTAPNPDNEEDGLEFTQKLNPESLAILEDCKMEPALNHVEPSQSFQFLRQGYFAADPDSREGYPVFNRIVSLRDTWAKIQQKG